MFFVATAPSRGDGHVNVSPKGLNGVAVLSPTRVAYLDLTGSGAETIAHLRDNGRITLMFCAFEGPPNIVRVYGRGEAIPVGDPRAEPLLRALPAAPRRPDRRLRRRRPRLDLLRLRRPALSLRGRPRRAAGSGPTARVADLSDYRAKTNAVSIDGLPALDVP